MNRKMTAVFAAVLLVVSAVAVQAQTVIGASKTWTAKLHPTDPLGERYDAIGAAKKVVQGRVELFAMRIAATCEDGTIFLVRAMDKNGKEFDIGAITMLFDSGSLVIRNSDGPSPVFPLSSLERITVYERRGAILKGEFDE